MKIRKKSQTAIEFVIMISLLIFFFAVMVMIINYNLSDKYREKEEVVVKDIAYSIQDEINMASKATDGYCRPFKLPAKVLGKDYEVNIDSGDPSLVEVKTSRVSIVLPLPPKINVVNNGEDKATIRKQGETPGENIIEKKNGEVYLNYKNSCNQ